MPQLLVATHNQGKLTEIKEIFKNSDLKILSLNDIQEIGNFEVEENAETHEGNAITKAIIYGKKAGILTVADDSGLEIDALNGRPGVNSARYIDGSDANRYNKVLSEMKDILEDERTCRYRCVAAVYNPATEIVKTFAGVWEGRISDIPRGEKSFGYAPIFLSKDFNYKKTNAELDPNETIKINHRGEAFKKVKKYLFK